MSTEFVSYKPVALVMRRYPGGQYDRGMKREDWKLLHRAMRIQARQLAEAWLASGAIGRLEDTCIYYVPRETT